MKSYYLCPTTESYIAVISAHTWTNHSCVWKPLAFCIPTPEVELILIQSRSKIPLWIAGNRILDCDNCLIHDLRVFWSSLADILLF
jgi:hypothetical protein